MFKYTTNKYVTDFLCLLQNCNRLTGVNVDQQSYHRAYYVITHSITELIIYYGRVQKVNGL